MLPELMDRVAALVEHLRECRDERGYPTPRTVEELRNDPRVQLCNSTMGLCENLELAAALILLVAEDHVRIEEAVR